MRTLALFPALSILMLSGLLQAAEDKALEGREAVTTAKERLVNKAADPQRVNDCKVPSEKRDTARERDDDCPHLRQDEGESDTAADG